MSEGETILEADLYESENVIALAKPRAIGPFSSVQVAASALVVLLLLLPYCTTSCPQRKYFLFTNKKVAL